MMEKNLAQKRLSNCRNLLTDKNRKSGVEDIVTDGIYHKVESFHRHSRIYGICCTKIMGKRLGHYWRKVVWILLTIKMCFPFWSVTEKFRQHFFIISMPAYYMGEQNQKTAIMTKIGNVSIREWMSGEKFLPYIWLAGMILCLLFHAIQYRIWKKEYLQNVKECKKIPY